MIIRSQTVLPYAKKVILTTGSVIQTTCGLGVASLLKCCSLVEKASNPSILSKASSNFNCHAYITFSHNEGHSVSHIFETWNKPCVSIFSLWNLNLSVCHKSNLKLLHARCMSSNALFELKIEKDVVRFAIGKPDAKSGRKKSKRAKVKELKFYRLKARRKMNSPNPEVRIMYKLGKAKRKEAWLIEKLRKFMYPKVANEVYDPEILTEEERFYLKRTGEKKKHYVPLGRRGVIGGVVLNMHLHWKHHETVKVVCRPCKPGQVHEYAEELARLSKGIVIDIKPDNIIIFFRGKNYVQPEVMSPPDTLSKYKALEKYKYEQSLEHTGEFIEKLEKELNEYREHVAKYSKGKEDALVSVVNTS